MSTLIAGHSPSFFEYCIRQETIFRNSIKLLSKAFRKTRQMSKTQSTVVLETKILQLLSACKNQIQMILQSHGLEGLAHL